MFNIQNDMYIVIVNSCMCNTRLSLFSNFVKMLRESIYLDRFTVSSAKQVNVKR